MFSTKKDLLKKPNIILGVVILLIIIILIIVATRSHDANKAVANLPRQAAPSANISIGGNNGQARVFGVIVSSISGNTLTATGTINNAGIQVTINVAQNTTVHLNNATSSLSSIAVGDIVMITGTLQSFAPTFAINATDIRVLGIINPNSRQPQQSQNSPQLSPETQNSSSSTASSTSVIHTGTSTKSK